MSEIGSERECAADHFVTHFAVTTMVIENTQEHKQGICDLTHEFLWRPIFFRKDEILDEHRLD